jgi:hypothetical protein
MEMFMHTLEPNILRVMQTTKIGDAYNNLSILWKFVMKFIKNEIKTKMSIYEWNLFVCFVCFFCLSHWDIPNHDASCHAFATIGNPSMMTRGALN